MKDYRGYAKWLGTFSAWNIASHEDLPLNYIFTPKNACSTVKATLLGTAENPHQEFQGRFCSGPIDVAKPFFCLTRNPYDRVLSAYLDKIGVGKDAGVWLPFCKRYGVDPASQPTLIEFLDIIGRDENPHLLNPHFQPQFYVNNARFVRPHFIGRVERIPEVADFLLGSGYKLMHFAPHAQHASARRHELSSREVEAIRAIYRLDFEHYGYDFDHVSNDAAAAVFQPQIVSLELKSFGELRGRIAPKKLIALASANEDLGKIDVSRSLLHKALMLDQAALAAVLQFEERQIG